MNRRQWPIILVAGLLLSGCPPKNLNKTGKWNLSRGESADTLRLEFSNYRHTPEQRKADASGEMLRIRLIRTANTLRFDLPCAGCQAIYEEGPLLLTFGSAISTGTLQFEKIEPQNLLSGKLGLRFVQPDPPMETSKHAVWLEWDFKAQWKPDLKPF